MADQAQTNSPVSETKRPYSSYTAEELNAMSFEQEMELASDSLASVASHAVYKRGLRGRITRTLLPLAGSGKIKHILGVNKLIRWTTNGAIKKDTLTIAQASQELSSIRKQVRKIQNDFEKEGRKVGISPDQMNETTEMKMKKAELHQKIDEIDQEIDEQRDLMAFEAVTNRRAAYEVEQEIEQEIDQEIDAPEIDTLDADTIEADTQEAEQEVDVVEPIVSEIVAEVEVAQPEAVDVQPAEQNTLVVHVLKSANDVDRFEGENAALVAEHTYSLEELDEFATSNAALTAEELEQKLASMDAMFEEFNANAASVEELEVRAANHAISKTLLSHAAEISEANTIALGILAGDINKDNPVEMHNPGLINMMVANHKRSTELENVRIDPRAIVGVIERNEQRLQLEAQADAEFEAQEQAEIAAHEFKMNNNLLKAVNDLLNKPPVVSAEAAAEPVVQDVVQEVVQAEETRAPMKSMQENLEAARAHALAYAAEHPEIREPLKSMEENLAIARAQALAYAEEHKDDNAAPDVGVLPLPDVMMVDANTTLPDVEPHQISPTYNLSLDDGSGPELELVEETASDVMHAKRNQNGQNADATVQASAVREQLAPIENVFYANKENGFGWSSTSTNNRLKYNVTFEPK